jgi:transcriptional regulator with XRE-family HTH domain
MIRVGLFLTQEELAGLMDVHRRTIMEWENGRRPVPMGACLALKFFEHLMQCSAFKFERGEERPRGKVRVAQPCFDGF